MKIMKEYFVKRILLIFPTIFGITLITFLILQAVPGGPLEIEISKWRATSENSNIHFKSSNNFEIPESALLELKKFYGFDKPIFERYLIWGKNVLTLNLGKSYVYSEPVWDVILERLPVSIYFGTIGFILTYIICIPLGIYKAIHHKNKFDVISSVIVFFAYSMPGWAFGAIMLMIFGGGSFFDILPLGGFISDNFSQLNYFEKITDLFSHTLLPVIAYLIGSFATLTVLTKNSVMENIGMDYVLTAKTKGLSKNYIFFKHIFRNSLIPLATGLGHFLSLILTGSFLIETIFNIQGLGQLGYNSIMQRDYPVVMGLLFISSILLLFGNLFSDFLYAAFDPRIRFKKDL